MQNTAEGLRRIDVLLRDGHTPATALANAMAEIHAAARARLDQPDTTPVRVGRTKRS